MLIFIIIYIIILVCSQMDFGEFELEQAQQKPSLKELQKIYSKNQKRRSQLDEINNHNKHMAETEQASYKYQSQKNAPTLENHNLLNESQKSFKTVPKLFSQLSILIHVLSIIMIVLLKQVNNLTKIICSFIQMLAIVMVVLHYYKKLVSKVAHIRSKLIMLQVGCLIVADIVMFGIIISNDHISVAVGLLLGIDIILLIQLARLYKMQKMMDEEVFSQKMQPSQLD